MAGRRKSFLGPVELDINMVEGSKRDIGNSKFIVKSTINSVEDFVYKKEEQRDYKMRSNEIIFIYINKK
jgi:hypothetical protein